MSCLLLLYGKYMVDLGFDHRFLSHLETCRLDADEYGNSQVLTTPSMETSYLKTRGGIGVNRQAARHGTMRPPPWLHRIKDDLEVRQSGVEKVPIDVSRP